MDNKLGKDFSMKELLKYTLPSVFMMLFMSTYTIIDGIFVANLVGEDALAAVNLVMPLFGIVMAISLMFATGGNAVIAKFMGEGRNREAKEFLTVLYVIGGILGIVLTIGAFVFDDTILKALGVWGDMYLLAKTYLLVIAVFVTPIIFQVFIQSFLVTAGKPTLGLVVCVMGGITNMILDYVLIAPNMLDLGIAGAGIATGIGNSLPGVVGILYFAFNKKSTLHFVKPVFHVKTILKSMYNGMSELVGSLSFSITAMMFNFILMSIAGESGVAAISVILYIQQFQTALYFGFTLGISPIIAYKYGENNRTGLHKVIRQGFIFMVVVSTLVIVLTVLLSNEAVGIFIDSSSNTFEMAKRGLLMFAPAYIFMGVNVFLSSMFTALSNGKVSAILSILRSLVFIVIVLLVLPRIFGIDGVWIAVPVAEILAIFVGIYYYRKYKKVYGY